MTKETKNNGHPEGGIYELLAHTPKLPVYPNISDMNELGEIFEIKRRRENDRCICNYG